MFMFTNNAHKTHINLLQTGGAKLALFSSIHFNTFTCILVFFLNTVFIIWFLKKLIELNIGNYRSQS